MKKITTMMILGAVLAATDARCFVTCGVPVAIVGTKGGGQHGEAEWADPETFPKVSEYLVRFIAGEGK